MGQFKTWTRQYNQNYTKEEFNYRLSVFIENAQYIEASNSENLTYTLGAN